MVIPSTTQETEEDIWREEAAAESQRTITQSEALQMEKVDTRRPQETGMSLRRC